MNRAPRAAEPALTIVVTTAVAAGTAVAGTGTTTALVVADVLVRLAVTLAAAAVLGILASVLRHHGDDPRRDRMLDVAAAGAGVWAVAAAVTAFLRYLTQAPALSSPRFGPGLVAFVANTPAGRDWLRSAVAAAVLTALLVVVRSRVGLAVLAVLAAVALFPVAVQAAGPPGALAVGRSAASAAFVQLAGVATWLGVAATSAWRPGARSAVTSFCTRLPVVCGVLVLGATAVAATLPSAGGRPSAPMLVAVSALLLALTAAVARGMRPSRRLLRLELLLLGAVAGAATAAAVRSAAVTTTGTTPAEILTGAPLPPPPTLGALLAHWQPDAVWLAVSGGLLVPYVRAVVRVRRRGRAWSNARVVSWVGGAVLLGWLTSGGPAGYQQLLLSVQLAQTAALTTTVPVLLAAGAPLRLLGIAAASEEAEGRGSHRRLLRVLRARPVQVLGRPVPAVGLAAAGLAALYGTGLLRWSLTDPLGAEWVVAQCLLTGGLVTRACLRGTGRSVLAVVVLLVLETVGAIALLAGGLLLADRYGAMGWGADALADQRLGAVLGWTIAAGSTLALLVLARGRRRGAGSSVRTPHGSEPRVPEPAGSRV